MADYRKQYLDISTIVSMYSRVIRDTYSLFIQSFKELVGIIRRVYAYIIDVCVTIYRISVRAVKTLFLWAKNSLFWTHEAISTILSNVFRLSFLLLVITSPVLIYLDPIGCWGFISNITTPITSSIIKYTLTVITGIGVIILINNIRKMKYSLESYVYTERNTILDKISNLVVKYLSWSIIIVVFLYGLVFRFDIFGIDLPEKLKALPTWF